MRLQWEPLSDPLWPILLGCIEEKIFSNSNITKPKLYHRCINNIFAIFDDDCIFKLFLNGLKTQLSHLKFTIEKAIESFSFLELEVTNFDNGFEHSMYHKLSNADLTLNYYTNCPKIWKPG